jgi:catechol 2,3-dioxygenase-like lactoylglutathione lyase family enzyme
MPSILAQASLDPVLLVTDLAAARRFYVDGLGLEVALERADGGLELQSGPARIVLSPSSTGTADEQTQARWVVPDLRAALAELRTRGIAPVDYDLPGLRTVDGVLDAGPALTAWIVDPAGNALAITELRAA